jgi:hypothetical protein
MSAASGGSWQPLLTARRCDRQRRLGCRRGPGGQQHCGYVAGATSQARGCEKSAAHRAIMKLSPSSAPTQRTGDLLRGPPPKPSSRICLCSIVPKTANLHLDPAPAGRAAFVCAGGLEQQQPAHSSNLEKLAPLPPCRGAFFGRLTYPDPGWHRAPVLDGQSRHTQSIARQLAPVRGLFLAPETSGLVFGKPKV